MAAHEGIELFVPLSPLAALISRGALKQMSCKIGLACGGVVGFSLSAGNFTHEADEATHPETQGETAIQGLAGHEPGGTA
jgi:hypothetical protein